jgi:hypothetical protein
MGHSGMAATMLGLLEPQADGSLLKATLDARPKRSPVILLSTDNKLRSSWRDACEKAGVVGVTFNNLRAEA